MWLNENNFVFKKLFTRFSSIFGHIGEYEVPVINFIGGGRHFLSDDGTICTYIAIEDP